VLYVFTFNILHNTLIDGKEIFHQKHAKFRILWRLHWFYSAIGWRGMNEIASKAKAVAFAVRDTLLTPIHSFTFCSSVFTVFSSWIISEKTQQNCPKEIFFKGKTWHTRWLSNARQAIKTLQWHVSTVDSFSLTTRLWFSTALKLYFQTVVGRALLVTCSQDVNMLWWWSYTGPYPDLKDWAGQNTFFGARWLRLL